MDTRLTATAVLALSLFCLPASADDFRPNPSTVKYKDSGVPAAKGRSGSAAIEARALLNKNGTVDVEITTGQFDPYVAGTGSIERVQVKAADADPVNYNNTAGGSTFTISGLTGLHRLQPIEITAHVTGADGSRTGVVTVTDTVKLRPNLAFTWYAGQQHGMVNMPVSVSVTVNETNGDSGARADCVLREGTVELDRASNIWVDAGGSVTCRMSAAFATSGMKYLNIVLDNIRPGDYDPADNVIHGSTQIHDYNEELNEWDAMAREETATYYSNEGGSDYGYEWRNSGWTMSYGIRGYQREVLDMSTLRFSYRATTDGRVLNDVADVPFKGYRFEYGQACGRATIGYVTATACTWIYDPERQQPPSSDYSVGVEGGDVTYYSNEWSRWFNPETGTYEYWTYNYSYQNTYGSQERLGSNVVQDFVLTDGTRTFFAHPAITLQPFESHYTINECYSPTYCRTYSQDRVGKFGTTRGGLGY